MKLNTRDVEKTDISSVDKLIIENIDSHVSLARDVCNHLISSGGKKLRSKLVLMSHNIFSNGTEKEKKDSLNLAASVEFLHNATLMHDDIIDNAKKRRHKPSANFVFGNNASILCGDFLFSKSFEMMISTNRTDVLKPLSNAIRVIIEGELLQIMYSGAFDISMNRYIEIVHSKTAVLFSAACEVGAISANASTEEIESLKMFGENLGMSFQMIDDVLDYDGNEKDTGKDIGADFREGKVTLPIIVCNESLHDKKKKEFELSFEEKDFEKCMSFLKSTDSLNKSRIIAKKYSDKAYNIINKYVKNSLDAKNLQELCDLSIKRRL